MLIQFEKFFLISVFDKFVFLVLLITYLTELLKLLIKCFNFLLIKKLEKGSNKSKSLWLKMKLVIFKIYNSNSL